MFLVFDRGSGFCKVGFSGDEEPLLNFSTVVGIPKYTSVFVDSNLRDSYVGDEAQTKRGVLTIKYPIERGLITNWDEMEKIWSHTFNNELGIDPYERDILLTDSPFNPKANREKMLQMMIELYNFKGFSVSLQALLSMFASGRSTGLIVVSKLKIQNTSENTPTNFAYFF